MEESQKRKERLQAMRMEAAHNTPDKEDKDFQAASGILSNPLNDSSPSSSAEPHTPRFDYYTDPLSAFSASKRKGTINRSPNGRGNSLNRFRISPMNHQPSSVNNSSPNHPASQQPIWQPNFHSSNNQSPVTNAQQPIWQPIFHSDNNQTPTTPFGSPVRGYINAHVSCGPQYYSSPGGFSNSSNGSPMSVSPVPRFNQTPNQDNFWQQQQQQQLPPQPPQQQSGSQPRQYGRGSPGPTRGEALALALAQLEEEFPGLIRGEALAQAQVAEDFPGRTRGEVQVEEEVPGRIPEVGVVEG